MSGCGGTSGESVALSPQRGAAWLPQSGLCVLYPLGVVGTPASTSIGRTRVARAKVRLASTGSTHAACQMSEARREWCTSAEQTRVKSGKRRSSGRSHFGAPHPAASSNISRRVARHTPWSSSRRSGRTSATGRGGARSALRPTVCRVLLSNRGREISTACSAISTPRFGVFGRHARSR
jgi:hypothetical protein